MILGIKPVEATSHTTCKGCMFDSSKNGCEHPDENDDDFVIYCGPDYDNIDGNYIFIKSISGILKGL